MPAKLTIHLFGSMRVFVNGDVMPPVRSRQVYWLLALLVLRNGRPTSREWIASMLWPDAGHATALANLRPILSELRRALGSEGGRLQSSERAFLAFDLEEVVVDVLEFDAAFSQGLLQQAIDIYEGHLLEGCPGEWAQQERSMREERCAQAFEELGNQARQTGNHDRAIDLFRKLIAFDPWREAARRGLMQTLADSGDVNEALQAYREYASFLSGEAGTVPDQKTADLYQDLRESLRRNRKSQALTQSELTSRVTGNLPHVLTSLVGLEDEKLDVADRLRRHRMVTLTGFGGIGKTRLAREVAHHMSREFVGGVWLVALDSLVVDQLVQHQIARTLGVPDAPGNPALHSLIDRLANTQTLLVLDNCEHLLVECSKICEALLQACGGLRSLATSREPLGLAGEKIWHTAALSVPDLVHLPGHTATQLRVVNSFEGVQLFVERARAIDDGFRLGPDNALTVAEICGKLEGIPLAIELAAACVKSMSIHQIAQRVRDPLSLLNRGQRSAVPRQQTLRATIDWSYRFLEKDEQSLLHQVAQFVGGWTLEAAEAICDGPEVAVLLGALVDKSLVVFEPSVGRYRLLETVRQYALGQAEDRDELFQHRFLKYFCELVELIGADIRGAGRDDALDSLKAEEANIRQAVLWAEESVDPEGLGLRLATAWADYWFSIGRFGECLRHIQSMLSLDRPMDPRRRAKALSNASLLASAGGKYQASLKLEEDALRTYREIGDLEMIASSARTIGDALWGLGKLRSAQPYFEEAYRIARQLGNERLAAISGILLGTVCSSSGEVEAARIWMEDGLTYFTQANDLRGVSWTLNHLGNVYLDNEMVDQSFAYFERALQIDQEVGGYVRGYYLDNLAKASLGTNLKKAQECLEQGLAFVEENDDPRCKVCLLRTKAEVENEMGRFDLAIQTTQKMFRSMNVMESPYDATYGLVTLGFALLGLENGFDGVATMAAARGNQERMGMEVAKVDHQRQDRYERHARDLMSSANHIAAWSRGYALELDQAIEFALSVQPTLPRRNAF